MHSVHSTHSLTHSLTHSRFHIHKQYITAQYQREHLLHLHLFSRQGQLLNIRGEKTSEDTFFRVVSDVTTRWQQETGASLVDYCCAESALTEKGDGAGPCYVVFVELDGENMHLTAQQKDMVRPLRLNR